MAWRAIACASSQKPPLKAGWPQQVSPWGTKTVTPSLSSTSAAARPMSGISVSTMQVAKNWTPLIFMSFSTNRNAPLPPRDLRQPHCLWGTLV